MERVKRSLSELSDRQKRRIAQNAQRELERYRKEDPVDSSTDEDVCAPPVTTEGEATESLIEVRSQQGSEVTSNEDDDVSLIDPVDSSTDEDVCALPVAAEAEATESLIEVQSQRGSEFTSEGDDDISLNDPDYQLYCTG